MQYAICNAMQCKIQYSGARKKVLNNQYLYLIYLAAKNNEEESRVPVPTVGCGEASG